MTKIIVNSGKTKDFCNVLGFKCITLCNSGRDYTMSIIDLPEQDAEKYRNELASIAMDGSRKWIYARQPKGNYYNARTIVALILLGFLFLAPHITVHGHQFMLLNFLKREFIVFGYPFMPQDFHLVVLLALTSIVSVALFTAVLGRIWCGWMCPQTIFMEMIFRRLEWLIEGTPNEQISLQASKWTPKKLIKKITKHIVFFSISFLIANTFLAYIIGSEELFRIITDNPIDHILGLGIITLFSFVFYAVFARFREQACLIACPYGRYQSVLVDPNTIAITYDFKRGEPRGTFKKSSREIGIDHSINDSSGDCIDCHQCIVVCPTGIDIRNGIQLECINCSACIDACNTVMDKLKKPRGLIRYTSWNAIHSGIKQVFTTRIKGYLAIWIILITIVSGLFAKKSDTETLILRQPGTTFIVETNGGIANFFSVAITNKTFEKKQITIALTDPLNASLKPLGSFSPVEGLSTKESRLLISLPKGSYHKGKNTLHFNILSNNNVLETVESTFIAP
jgi:cytochrome c oxidase accessory protein FixG